MKNITKRSLVIVLAVVIMSAAVASAFAETIFTDNNGFSYTQLDGNFASVCDWEGGSETLRIPLKVNNSYVKEISAWAFSDRSDFTMINFDQADYLALIGTMAFKRSAISGSVNLPAQIKTIGTSAFQECASLDTLYYNATADIPDQCFYKCIALENVAIAAGVTKIGNLAFAGCESLSYVRIPRTVTDISETSFKDNNNLVIYCYTDSYAHQYAVDNGIDYVLIDAPAPTEPTVATEPTVPTEPTTATEATVPTETAATEPATTAPVSYILGDVDNSGNVDVVDATFAQRYTTHADIPADILDGMVMRGDVDENEDLDSADVTFIMRHLIRVATPYSIGETVTRVI